MRQEVMTGAERRRRWSDSEKRSILGEVGVRGATVAEVARRHDLTRQHIYQWRAEMRHRGESLSHDVDFLPVEILASLRRNLGFRAIRELLPGTAFMPGSGGGWIELSWALQGRAVV
jgi:transposase